MPLIYQRRKGLWIMVCSAISQSVAICLCEICRESSLFTKARIVYENRFYQEVFQTPNIRTPRYLAHSQRVITALNKRRRRGPISQGVELSKTTTCACFNLDLRVTPYITTVRLLEQKGQHKPNQNLCSLLLPRRHGYSTPVPTQLSFTR